VGKPPIFLNKNKPLSIASNEVLLKPGCSAPGDRVLAIGSWSVKHPGFDVYFSFKINVLAYDDQVFSICLLMMPMVFSLKSVSKSIWRASRETALLSQFISAWNPCSPSLRRNFFKWWHGTPE
jgi:hypothetical protein